MNLADIIGLGGVFLTLLAYCLLQTSVLKVEGVFYSLVNALGSAMILYSLYYEWNTSAAVMEGAWLLLSLFGGVKAYWKKRQITY
jgi:hypothetical protein